MTTATTYRYRVSTTCGSICTVKTARRRFRCDGHMASEQHFIEPGERYVRDDLPPNNPEIGNPTWWHARFCKDCCPERFAAEVSR